jgi:hypothetical protein
LSSGTREGGTSGEREWAGRSGCCGMGTGGVKSRIPSLAVQLWIVALERGGFIAFPREARDQPTDLKAARRRVGG